MVTTVASATCSSPVAGVLINVDSLNQPYFVDKIGNVKGAGGLTGFDRTGNTYGMEAWVHVGPGNKIPEHFARPVPAP